MIKVIGLDIAKEFFQLHGVDDTGTAVLRRRLRRHEIADYFRELEPCLIGIEATGSSYYWARLLTSMGHKVKLMPARYVKPYVKLNKNDANDAEAICEAVQRPTMRFVSVKSEAQRAVLILHRSRDILIRQRTMLINALRGHLSEFGIVAPRGTAGAANTLANVEESSIEAFPAMVRAALRILVHQVHTLNENIEDCERRIMRWHEKNAASNRLATVPGIGPLAASALVATVGDARSFRSGRQLAAWIGLVPRQYSSGGKKVLGRITRHGDRYLRRLLFLGAKSMMMGRSRGPLAEWSKRLRARRPYRVAAIALANKMARIVWALLVRGDEYRPAT